MKAHISRILYKLAPVLDVIMIPLTYICAMWSLFVRSAEFQRMPWARSIYLRLGVIPVRRHYYDPFYDPNDLHTPLDHDRFLPGVALNVEGQLALVKSLNYQEELLCFPIDGNCREVFCYHNDFFGPGDAEFLYGMIRKHRPQKIVEVGSGNSTLMILNALAANRQEDSGYHCKLFCIEPYEATWLKEQGVNLIQQKVEEVQLDIFTSLESGDILFIDSSHVIRPQGDVLHIVLQILPQLRPGVLIQLHDILTPRDYFSTWLVKDIRMWNEQYLVEAFLSCNKQFEVIGALNYLKHHYFAEIASACPLLRRDSAAEPGSLWLRRL